jgi:parvulin-like peptidyl-prolyl isomerase
MPLMTKIRESMTTFFSVFAGVFVVYIVLDWGMDITGRRHTKQLAESQEIGTINGQAIPTKEFTELVKQATDNQKAQTGTEPDENQLRTLRDQVWNQMIDQKLYDDEIKRLGITVADKEIVDWVTGENPPDFLQKQFTDSTGTFDRVRYDATIKNPKNKDIMVRVEDALRKQREREKLQSVILASVQVPEGDVLEKFIDNNIKYDADYILFDPNILVKDDEVKVSDDDLRRFYNDHSEEFKVEATRKLKYVQFNNAPSKSDSESVINEIADVKKRALEGMDFLDLAKTYSETPLADTYFKHGELSQEKESAIFSAKSGDIIGPMNEFDGFHLIKVLDFRNGKDDFLRASHILITIENNDSVKALKEATKIAAEIKHGGDFAELARKNSKDPGSGQRGGDLGWFGKGRMVKPFDEAAYKAKVGQIVGPIRTQFGYHIIKVTARDNREVKIADIHTQIRVSSQTKSDIEQHAQDFQYLAKEGDFVKEATQSKFTVAETQPFQKNGVIPGIGQNSSLNKFAFTNKPGSVSNVITLQNSFGVFMISEAKEAGIRPFDELKASLEARVKREKKMEKVKTIASELRQSLSGNDELQKITAKRPDLPVAHAPSFTLGGSVPSIGHDPGFIGGISSLNVGEISKPFEGQRGIFIAKLTGKSPFDSVAYKAQVDGLRSQLLAEKRTRYLSEWSEQLKKAAEIVDNRDLFFR